jgi:hypothetical protein
MQVVTHKRIYKERPAARRITHNGAGHIVLRAKSMNGTPLNPLLSPVVCPHQSLPETNRLGLDGDGTVTAALVTLRGHNLVVVGAEREASLGPGVEVGADIDRARGAVALADGPELVKGAGALDGGLVDARRLGDRVGAAVLLERAERLGVGRGVIVAERLDDVVLDQRVLGPPVDGQIAVALRVEAARVGDGAGRAGVPVGGWSAKTY